MKKDYRVAVMALVTCAVLVAWGMSSRSPVMHVQAQAPEAPLIWQSVPHAGAPKNNRLYRAPVPGGWLVWIHRHEEARPVVSRSVGQGIGMSSGLTFVPDPEHQWK